MPASLWTQTATPLDAPALDADRSFDVAVVGAGIVGVTAALMLAREGTRVGLFEADRVGHGVSGYSTAKVTSQHKVIYSEIAGRFGAQAARIYAEANQAGLAQIATLAEELGIDCDLRRKPAYVWAASQEDLPALREEAAAAQAARLPAVLTGETDLPWAVPCALRFDDQAEFHPVKYLVGLARAAREAGAEVYERSRAVGASDGETCRVEMESGATVTAGHVIVATHIPFLDRGAYFARTHPERSYAIALAIDGRVPQGMYISTNGGHSLRAARDGDEELLLVGGEGHKVGQADERERMEALETWARKRFEVREVRARWSSQDNVSVDGLPYVGLLAPFSKRLLTATGFRKWGFTNGAAAAQMLTDRVLGRPNAWAETFDSNRLGPPHAAVEFAKENADVGARFFTGRLRRGAVNGLAPGEGRIVRDGLGQAAVSRDDSGRLHKVSARCTHLGCIVDWNTAERTWDCPCHGSRFGPDGRVLQGPAVAPLESRAVLEP